jgi:hypothetical protein
MLRMHKSVLPPAIKARNNGSEGNYCCAADIIAFCAMDASGRVGVKETHVRINGRARQDAWIDVCVAERMPGAPRSGPDAFVFVHHPPVQDARKSRKASHNEWEQVDAEVTNGVLLQHDLTFNEICQPWRASAKRTRVGRDNFLLFSKTGHTFLSWNQVNHFFKLNFDAISSPLSSKGKN